MSRIVTHNESVSGYPTSYNSDHSYYSIAGESSAYTTSTSSTFCTVNMTRGSRANSYIYWEFDLPQIPSNATLGTITCNYRAGVSSTTTKNIASATIQMCTGTSTKGSSKSIMNTSPSASAFTSAEIGSWTVAEINAGVKLKQTATRGNQNTNSNYAMRFYGADITVNYSWDETFYAISTSSSVQGVGISAQDSETTSGGTDVITITGVSDLSDIKLMDNGTDVTSSLVRSGSNYTYTLNNVNADHVITVEDAITAKPLYLNVDGAMKLVSSIQKKTNNAWEAISFVDFWRKINGSYLNDSSISGKTTLIYGGEIETVSYDEVGTVNKTTSDLTITINDNALQSGTYKMFYEDTNRTIIDRIDEITEFTI